VKTTWTVAAREFAARKTVLYAGLLAAALTFASPFVPGALRADPAEVRAIVFLFLGTSVAAGSALLVGATLFGTDLAEKRLAWYFSRPISPASLWWGKLAGGSAVVLLGSAIASSPVLLNTTSLVSVTATGSPVAALLGITVALLFGLFVLANAVSVAFRSHSLWLVFDVAGLVSTGVALWVTVRILVRAEAQESVLDLALVLAGVVPVALALAGWRQVAAGRTDPKAAHAALSKTLWAIVVSASFAAVAYAGWVVSYRPSDLRHPVVGFAPTGKWILVSGQVARRVPEFQGAALLDSETGRFVRLSMGTAWSVTFSRDGRRAAWAERDGMSWNDPVTVVVLDTASSGAVPWVSRIVVGRARDLELLTLSPDGSRLALIAANNLAIHDVSTGAIVASVLLPGEMGRGRIFFDSPTSVRLYWPFVSGPSTNAALLRFDLATKKLEETGSVDYGEAKSTYLRISPAGDRLLLTSASAGTWLLDGLTGQRIASLAQPDETSSARSQFLSDGRIAVGRLDGGGASLQLFSRAGQPESTIPIGAAKSFQIGGELAPGKLVVNLSSREALQEDARYGRIAVVDLAKGTAAEVGNDFALGVLMLPMWVRSDSPWCTPGSLGTRLLRSKDDRLLLVDPATGRPSPFSALAR
jgi:hypothetical protein